MKSTRKPQSRALLKARMKQEIRALDALGASAAPEQLAHLAELRKAQHYLSSIKKINKASREMARMLSMRDVNERRDMLKLIQERTQTAPSEAASDIDEMFLDVGELE